MQFGKDFPPQRDKQPSSRNSSALSIKSPGLLVQKKTDDARTRLGSKSGTRSNPPEKTPSKDFEARPHETQIPAAGEPAKSVPPLEKPAQPSGPQSPQKLEEAQQPATAKAESRSEDSESYRQLMAPPLVVFGGQSAVRLDPLLTRKSSARSGRRG